MGCFVGAGTQDETFVLQLPILPCARGHALTLLPQPPSHYCACYCDMCYDDVVGEVYHCETCQSDAHPDCVEIRDKQEVFFYDHPLHLLVRNFYQENVDAVCYLCKEVLQDSDWVYRCERCELDVHALCAKYPREKIMESVHRHPLTLREYLPQKSLARKCCNGEVRTNTWHYTCIQKWCRFDLHPHCSIQPWKPLCILDGSHQLRPVKQEREFHCSKCDALGLHLLYLVMEQRGFHCSKCGGVGFSWCYHCGDCDVDIHLDCLHDMDEVEDYWNEACERFLLEYATKDDHGKVNVITHLLEELPSGDALQASLSSISSPPPGTMRITPTIRRPASSEKLSLDVFDDADLRRKIVAETAERKVKRMAAKGERQKLKAKCALEMFGKLERVVLDLQSSKTVSQGDAEVLASILEMLEKRRYIVEEEMATQVQSTIRHGPRTCLFFQYNEDRGVYELLASLVVDMQDLRMMFLCEEPGHQHLVPDTYHWIFYGALGEERLEKLQPLLASGLQVVLRAMSTLAGELPQLDRVMLTNLGPWTWDLRATDLEKHGKLLEDKEKVEEMKRAKDSAAEWILDDLDRNGEKLYEVFGLLRLRYKATEEGDRPRYIRGSLAWLCVDHMNRGLKSGILQSYPVKYLNPELN